VKHVRFLVPALLAVALAGFAPHAWALSSGDLIKQGVSLLRDGKTQDALDLFTRAQKLDPASPRPHYYIASALERLGAADSAAVEYQTALRINPKYVEALTGYGKLLRKQGKTAEGTQKLEEAVKYNGKDPAALYGLGQAYLEDKKFDDAEKVFRKGTLLKTGRAQFLAGTALAIEGKGDLKEAEELFIRARETDPNNLRVRLEMGNFYMRKKIPVLAAPEFGHATTLNPKDPETHYMYGRALVGMNEFNAALKAFVDATKQDSTYAPAYLETGRLFYRAKRYNEAAENFRVYTGLMPDAYEGYYELGRSLSETSARDPGARAEATAALSRANELKPDVTEVLGSLCKLYFEQGDAGRDSALYYCDRYASKADSLTADEEVRVGQLYVAAEDSANAVLHLNKAAAMDSTKIKDAKFQVGYMIFKGGNYEGSLPYFEQALQVDSTFLPALLNKGLAQLQLGRKSEAIGTLRQALVVRPNDSRTMVWIGQTMLQMEADSLPIALEMYQNAAAVDSANGDALRGAGLALLLMDRCSDAEPWFQRAKAVQPEHLQGHIWLAQTHAKCGDLTRAKQEFQAALEIDPNSREASKGLENIRNFEARKKAPKASGASTSP
jgi:tetratricopeptide (TPR) repeat protein